ncbi:uncharacterized protein SCHCODRAFT_02669176 [Schizophyllum commune H4-8]|uniref:Expressed protein n=1 Tax=Schizophyllum commune (strain H4-8 / FGSC 9210) TaxID=578458 RepID=D8QAL4_SCHCM|nr:uncharacterized protein SCHCODRAFT_02669176 [Schizophyllum commune H4-8]KAI5889941.1 hypothetical protein SCHCODRAFT_02669176 [Schizophyllum commune H4-8]
MEIVESPRSSIAMTFYPRSPLLDTPLTPPEFKLSEVPAGTQDVLREAEHRARALGGGETLQVIATQVHATRRVLTKYRHITVVVDTEAKRRHTTSWTDGVQLIKSICEEILQKLRDPANARDDEWLSRRRQRLTRYLTQLLKATKDIIADKRREYEVLIRMYNERKNFVFANIRAMEVDYDALREMRHWCGVEAARRYVRQDYY